jgi:hypothetical protein
VLFYNMVMEVTRKPTYSVEKRDDGSVVVTYSTQINGQEYSVEHRSPDQSTAMAGATDRLIGQIQNDHEEAGLKPGNITQKLGYPTRESPTEAKLRRDFATDAPEPNNENDESDEDFLKSIGDIEGASEEEAQILSRSRKAPNQNSETVHQKSESYKNHVPWFKSHGGVVLDGTMGTELVEPIPEYYKRPGDKTIQGKNNTIIVLGRDFSPLEDQIFSKSIMKREHNSGYSKHMGAGAIDIVVGRMAPYPVESIGPMGPILATPNFNTSRPPELLGLKLTGGEHPGLAMDASRIYISQLTNVDENFDLQKELYSSLQPEEGGLGWEKQKVVPTSAIVLKSDKLRFHSRQDIKIITGGPKETYNSLGNRIKNNNGIHLIAENGINKDGTIERQQPIPLGDNLELALVEILGLISDLSGAVDAIAETQLKFNSIVASSFEFLPIPSGVTAGNPFRQLAGIVTNMNLLIRTRLGAFFGDVNTANLQTEFLENSGPNYINSKYNTVN